MSVQVLADSQANIEEGKWASYPLHIKSSFFRLMSEVISSPSSKAS